MNKKKKEKKIKDVVIDNKYSNSDTNPEFNTDIDHEVEALEINNEDDIYDDEIIDGEYVSENIPPFGERP